MSRQSLRTLGRVTWAPLLVLAAIPTVALAADEHDHAAAEGEVNLLAFEPNLAFWTLIVFLLLLVLLRKFAWKPIVEALDRREEHLKHVLYEAERARNESERLLAEHRQHLEQAADQVRAILDEARRDAQVTSDDIIRKAQTEAEAARQRAERDIATARDQALAEIWSKTADLAVEVAGRVLVKQLSEDEHRRLIEMAMQELPAGTNGQGSRS